MISLFPFSYLLLPVLLYPLDFLRNIFTYLLSFIAYFLFMPLLQICFQVYGFCNVHDVSWGNRPASTESALEHINVRDEQVANKVKNDYNMFRLKFLILWLTMTALHLCIFDFGNGDSIFTEHNTNETKSKKINNTIFLLVPYALWIIICALCCYA